MIKFPMAGLVLVLLICPLSLHARILWSEGGKKSTAQSRFNYDRTQDARVVSQFWAHNKMSVGFGLAGYHGLAGGTLGIHFHPDWSVEFAFGGGSHFQSYGLRGKRYFMRSSALSPFVGFGFHRWQRTTNRPFSPDAVVPNSTVRRFLSEEDLAASKIDERLAHGSLGLEYIFTSGDWAGIGLSTELLIMTSLQDFRSLTTVTVGMSYFF